MPNDFQPVDVHRIHRPGDTCQLRQLVTVLNHGSFERHCHRQPSNVRSLGRASGVIDLSKNPGKILTDGVPALILKVIIAHIAVSRTVQGG